jgi:isopenicillin N synthase-like dioxygenase
MADQTIPIFELEDLQRGQHLNELRQCVTDKGVFYLRDRGPLREAHRIAEGAAMTFFQGADDQAKQAVSNRVTTMRRGFSALESESTARVTNTGDYSDYAMVYSMGISNNVFPSPGFEQAWKTYFDFYYKMSQDAARIVLRSIGGQHGDDVDRLVDCDPVLRFRYFPEVPEDRCAERQPHRMAPHYDLSIVSLILQAPCPNGFVSLQVEIGGTFVDVPPLPDCLVVFCGSVATLVSEGKIKAPKHQVVSPGAAQRIGSDRTSSVFFLRPKPEFSFPIALARACGLDVELAGEVATFGEWCGTNYKEMHVKANA